MAKYSSKTHFLKALGQRDTDVFSHGKYNLNEQAKQPSLLLVSQHSARTTRPREP